MIGRAVADVLLIAAGLGVLALWLMAAEAALWLIRNNTNAHGGRK